MTASCGELRGRMLDLCLCAGQEGRPDPDPKLCIKYRESGLLTAGQSPSGVGKTSVGAKSGGCGGCGQKRAIPPRKSLLTRAVKLAEATARHIADDSAPTPPDALGFRESQCLECPLNVDRECRGCGCPLYPNLLNEGKLRWRSEECPAGKWARHNDNRRPLVNPTRNMIFHVFPLKGAEWNWHWHLEQIVRVAPYFNGRIAIGVGTGHNLAPVEEVQRRLEGVPVTDWIIRPNTKQLGETATFPDLLECVKTDDPNAVTFRGHTKGVTHSRTGIEQAWARLMWATCMDLSSVDDALASHLMAGPMKCHEPLVSTQKYRWFYAGTFYWFRNREIFQRDWRTMEQTRWYVEAWPGVLCTNAESACLCHDFTDGSVLREAYWREHVEADFELWKTARPNRRLDLE